MKKQPFLLTALLLPVFLQLNAQVKPVVLSEQPAYTGNSSTATITNQAVVAAFHKSHPFVTGDTWAKTRSGYLVSFTTAESRCTVFLDKRGNTTSEIRYFSAKDLPAAVRHQIQTAYGCFTPGAVREIKIKNTVVYLVTISNETSWKVIRVAGEEMDVTEEHKNG